MDMQATVESRMRESKTALEMSIQLPCVVRFEQETKTYVSECPPLNLLSGADTEADAVQAIQSAIVLYLQTLVEDKRLGDVLFKNGFRPTNDPKEILMAEHFVAVRVGQQAKSVSVKVPIGLLVANQVNVS
jgi:predicted RNase H-like HicB family nuclease